MARYIQDKFGVEQEITTSTVLTGTLTVAGWSNNAQTLTVSGLATTGYVYTVCPAPSFIEDYASCFIYADDVTVANKITFHCKEVPESPITVRIKKEAVY